MNKLFTLFVLFLFVTIFSFESSATVKTALGGNWNAPGTWSPAGVPSCGDTIIIPAGISVHIPANVNLNNAADPLCAQTYISVEGELTFSSGRKLRLAAGGCVMIEVGGTLVPSAVGGGSSEVVEVDHVDWWKAADGVLTGAGPSGTPLGCGMALPVELIDFSLEYINDGVDIFFTTASERDADKYLIEVSRDGSYWQELETVKAVGNSSVSSNYQLRDNSPFIGLSYYRLTLVDVNGNSTPLEVITSEFNSVKYLLYPIPVNKTMFLEGSSLETSTITVINSLGEQIEVEKSLMGDKYAFDFAEIKAGVYFLVIETENTKKTERIVVVHNK